MIRKTCDLPFFGGMYQFGLKIKSYFVIILRCRKAMVAAISVTISFELVLEPKLSDPEISISIMVNSLLQILLASL
jgi:hypothetical protein